MKVLIVRTFPDILDLSAYNVQEIGLAKALSYKGIECGVVLYHGNFRDQMEMYTFEREGIQYSFPIYWLRGFCFFKNGFMPSVYKLISRYDVLQVHEYDQIFSWMLYTSHKKPTVIYHGPYFHPYARGYNMKCRVFDLLFLGRRKNPDVVALTKSELAADFLKKKGFCHINAVGVGVDRDQFEIGGGEKIKCLLERKPGITRLLYVGKIEERRNVYFLIELFERLQEDHENLELVIVGNGDREYVEKFLERIALWRAQGKIHYFSRATQKELSLLYRNMDLFLFTSNYEIFGMVLLEAMYFGLPVISSKNGGASVLIKNGINGFQIEGFQVSDWQKVLECLLGDEVLYRRMCLQAHRTIEEGFLWERLADRFIDAYEEAERIFRKSN